MPFGFAILTWTLVIFWAPVPLVRPHGDARGYCTGPSGERGPLPFVADERRPCSPTLVDPSQSRSRLPRPESVQNANAAPPPTRVAAVDYPDRGDPLLGGEDLHVPSPSCVVDLFFVMGRAGVVRSVLGDHCVRSPSCISISDVLDDHLRHTCDVVELAPRPAASGQGAGHRPPALDDRRHRARGGAGSGGYAASTHVDTDLRGCSRGGLRLPDLQPLRSDEPDVAGAG